MFIGSYVSRMLRLKGAVDYMFKGCYVQRTLCSKDTMLKGYHVERMLCSKDCMFKGCCV